MQFDARAFYETLRRGVSELKERRTSPRHFFDSKTLNDQGSPHHIPTGIKDLPNGTILFMPGSPGRAKAIAENCFDKITTVLASDERAFNTYAGNIKEGDVVVPVAAMPSHMGFGTTEIAVAELLTRNIDTIIRVGTSGAVREKTLDGQVLSAGDIVVARTASFGFLDSLTHLRLPGERLQTHPDVYTAMMRAGQRVGGVVSGHTYSKGLLYEQEFLLGTPVAAYYHAVQKAVLAATGMANSEMEAAELYLTCMKLGRLLNREVKAGAFNLLIGEIRGGKEVGYVEKERIDAGMKRLYDMVRGTAVELYKIRQG